MTLRHLHIFKTVCTLNSITTAADKLGMTQPAISIAIKELEAFYNTKLFERMNRRIYLTESGQILLQYTDTILAQFGESIDVIRNDLSSFTCRIGSNVTFAEMYLANWIQSVKSKIKGIKLSVIVNDTEEIERKIISNEIDIAIIDKLSERQEIKSKLLYTESMCVACSPMLYSGSISMKELHHKPLLLREHGSGNRSSVEAAFLRHGLTAIPFVESTSTLSIIQMAKKDLGYSFLPKGVIDRELNNHELCQVPITDESFDRYYHLIYHKNKYLTKVMKQVMEIPNKIIQPDITLYP